MGSFKQVLVAALAGLVLLTVSAATTGASTVAAAESAPQALGAAPADGAAAAPMDGLVPIEASHEEEEGADESAADVAVTSRARRHPPRHPYRPRCKVIKICKIRIVYRRRPCRGHRYTHRTAVEGVDDEGLEAGDEEEGEVADGAAAGALETASRARGPRHYRRYRCRRVRCIIKRKCFRYPRH